MLMLRVMANPWCATLCMVMTDRGRHLWKCVFNNTVGPQGTMDGCLLEKTLQERFAVGFVSEWWGRKHNISNDMNGRGR